MSSIDEQNGGAAPSGSVPLRITVTSDSICPFCYIGLRKLEKALDSSPSISNNFFSPQIRFLPYQLDPTLPRDHAVDKRERYLAKFGPNFGRMEEMMKSRGKEVGIDFSYGGKLRSTLDSHRLMELAYARGGWRMQLAFLNKIMPAYFERAQDPGDPLLLASLAVEVGIFEHEKLALDFLASDDLKDEVNEGCKIAVAKGITGVPHFELEATASDDGQTLARAEVPGAQEVETFVAIIEKMTEKTKTNVAAKLAAANASAAASSKEGKANGAGATKCECCWKKVFGGGGK